jgi:hypothetical protein
MIMGKQQPYKPPSPQMISDESHWLNDHQLTVPGSELVDPESFRLGQMSALTWAYNRTSRSPTVTFRMTCGLHDD